MTFDSRHKQSAIVLLPDISCRGTTTSISHLTFLLIIPITKCKCWFFLFRKNVLTLLGESPQGTQIHHSPPIAHKAMFFFFLLLFFFPDDEHSNINSTLNSKIEFHVRRASLLFFFLIFLFSCMVIHLLFLYGYFCLSCTLVFHFPLNIRTRFLFSFALVFFDYLLVSVCVSERDSWLK